MQEVTPGKLPGVDIGMTKHSKVEYWHKKQGKGASVSASARHASIQEGRPLPNPAPKLSGAQDFLRKLKLEIRRSAEPRE